MAEPVVFDAAVVLGAAVRPDGSPSPALLRRCAHGAALAAKGRARFVLVSGGAVGHLVPEAHVMRDLITARGIAAGRVVVEDRSRNTVENAALSLPLAAARGWRRLVVVTDAFHLVRALYVFRRLATGMEIAGSAAPRPRHPGWEWRAALLREAVAAPLTLWRVERRRGITPGFRIENDQEDRP